MGRDNLFCLLRCFWRHLDLVRLQINGELLFMCLRKSLINSHGMFNILSKEHVLSEEQEERLHLVLEMSES